jgi:hypothetical protein
MTRLWFEEWRSFEDFKGGVERFSPSELNLRERTFKFWREAWLATQFVERAIHNKEEIKLRLTPEGSPAGDFQLDEGNAIHNFEVTEAMDPNSQPELKRIWATGGRIFQESEDVVSGKLAREKIPELIASKSRKSYPSGTILVIYVNLWTDFEREGFQGLVPESGHRFSAIWLLTSGRAEQIFPLGQNL